MGCTQGLVIKGVYIEEKKIYQSEVFCLKDELTLKTLMHRSIGAIKFSNPFKKSFGGSGVLISKDLILTAAHNLFDRQQKKENHDYKFFIQATNGVCEKYYEFEEWRYSPEYKECVASKKLQYDYALVKLKGSISYDQFLSLNQPCSDCLMQRNKQIQLSIFGYPVYGQNYKSKDPKGQIITLHQFGLIRKNRILLVQPSQFMIKYAISTEGGHSGCPVVVDDKIIAIHNGGEKDKFNMGRLITPDLINNLRKWREQLSGSQFFVNEKENCPHNSLQLTKLELLQKAQVQFKKGQDEHNKRNYSMARVYYGQCLEIQILAVGKGGRETVSPIFMIAAIYYLQNNYSKAIETYKQYISIMENYKMHINQAGYVLTLNVLGWCYLDMKDSRSAIQYLEPRLLHNQQIKNTSAAGSCANSLVRNLLALGEKERAQELKKRYNVPQF